MLFTFCAKILAIAGTAGLVCGVPDIDLLRVRHQLFALHAYGPSPGFSPPFLVGDADIDWPAVLRLARNVRNPTP